MTERSFPTISRHPGGFALRVALLALATAASSWAQGHDDTTSATSGTSVSELGGAKAQFAAAQKLYRAGKFADALPLFRDVAESTRSPNARLYVGHCLEQIGKIVDAYKVFKLIVKEISEHPEDKYGPTREAAMSELAVLSVRVGKVIISLADFPPDLTVTLDGVRVEEKELGSSIVVSPGDHRIEASASGQSPVRRDVAVEGGEVKTVTLSFKTSDAERAGPPSTAPPSRTESSAQGSTMRTIGFVTGGVGAAGLGVFAIAGLMAKNTFDKLDTECPSGCSDRAHLDDIDRGKSLQTTANVGLAVGVLGVGAGAALVILGASTDKEGPSVSFSKTGATFSYNGRF